MVFIDNIIYHYYYYYYHLLSIIVFATVLSDDYSTCMQLLMKYPPWFEVSDLVQRALHLRNPVRLCIYYHYHSIIQARYPDPVPHVREWTQISEDVHMPSSNQLHIQEDRSPEVVKMSHKVSNDIMHATLSKRCVYYSSVSHACTCTIVCMVVCSLHCSHSRVIY